MKNSIWIWFFLPLMLFGQNDSSKFYAGFRASRVLSSYPNNQFPQTEYWIRVAKEMSQKFPGSTPAGIWILSLYQGSGITQLSFPSGGLSVPNIQFTSVDYNESHLAKFDTSGVKVWLQVEPGNADIDTLISIVLNRYKHHSCVIGFGVDVEWYKNNVSVTDSAAQRWEKKVRSIDSTYTLFLKHYAKSWMPPTYRGNILFVDDSQDFTFSSTPFNTMVSEYKSWASKFAPNKSAFQFGYVADSSWWGKLVNPPKTIGDALRTNISTCSGVFWVDFTVVKVFPYTFVPFDRTIPKMHSLSQNYPNPFNPSTVIMYQLAVASHVTLTVYDLIGRKITTLVDEQKEEGEYSLQWNASNVSGGMYFYRLQAGSFTETKKLTLLK